MFYFKILNSTDNLILSFSINCSFCEKVSCFSLYGMKIKVTCMEWEFNSNLINMVIAHDINMINTVTAIPLDILIHPWPTVLVKHNSLFFHNLKLQVHWDLCLTIYSDKLSKNKCPFV